MDFWLEKMKGNYKLLAFSLWNKSRISCIVYAPYSSTMSYFHEAFWDSEGINLWKILLAKVVHGMCTV